MLRGATVLDGLGGRITNARVVIRDHRVAEVSLDDERVALPDGATVEDVRGRFLIPGLFDSHVHWGGSGGVGSSPIEQTDDRLSHDYGATLAAGVTSVVSLTDDVAAMEKLSVDVGAARTQRAADVLLRPVGHRSRRTSRGDVRLHAGPGRDADAAGGNTG